MMEIILALRSVNYQIQLYDYDIHAFLMNAGIINNRFKIDVSIITSDFFFFLGKRLCYSTAPACSADL